MDCKELAKHVGYETSNPSQDIRRFIEKIKRNLKDRDLNINIELTTNEVDLLLQGEFNKLGVE